MKQPSIHEAARRIATTLSDMKIPFAVAGALAANAHGHVRTTGDVAILIRPADLQVFKPNWLGRGWVERFAGSRGLRDVACNVNIDILLSGQFPGDGLPTPVAFPEPPEASESDEEGIPILTLPWLLQLRLASGMTAPPRPRDLAHTAPVTNVSPEQLIILDDALVMQLGRPPGAAPVLVRAAREPA